MASKLERWEEFLLKVIPPATIEFRKLMCKADPDSTPYASRYAAAEVQEGLLKQAFTFEPDADSLSVDVHGRDVSFYTFLARFYINKGLALIETDQLPEAERCLRTGLAKLDMQAPCQDVCIKMAALNNLGILYCNRMDHEEAMKHLEQVERMYTLVKQGGLSCEIATSLDSAEEQRESTAEDRVEELYTLALFYLAQVYQKCGDESSAADYCARTLGRQIDQGVKGGTQQLDNSTLDRGTWIQNATQLSCYYFNNGQYALAHHVLNAASEMLRLAKASGTELAEDVEANVHIGWARYYLSRMETSVLRACPGGAPLEAAEQPSASELPEAVRFGGLALAPPSGLPWGGAALATTFEGMRALFNACMPHLRVARALYQLDGWVTEHVQLLFDAALAYRNLAWFELDPHRRCVMHRQRAKQFEAVDGQLSFEHFPGLVRSIILEVAHAYRDILDIKQAFEWPAKKVKAARAEAAQHYARFLDTMRTGGQLPELLDEEWEKPVLNACLSSARVSQMHTGPWGASLDDLEQARQLLQYVSDYVDRNKTVGFDDEVGLSREMLGLIKEKIRLLHARAGADVQS